MQRVVQQGGTDYVQVGTYYVQDGTTGLTAR